MAIAMPPAKVGNLKNFFENQSSSGNSIRRQPQKPKKSSDPHTLNHKNHASFAIDINGPQSMIRPDQTHEIDKPVKYAVTTSTEERNEPTETRVDVVRNNSEAFESKKIETEIQDLENRQLDMHDTKKKLSSTISPRINEDIGLSPKVHPHQTVFMKTDGSTAVPLISLKHERKQGNVNVKEFSKPGEETEGYQIPTSANLYHAENNRTTEMKSDFKSNSAIDDTNHEKNLRMKSKQKAVFRQTKPALPPKPQPQCPSSTSPVNNDGLEVKRRKLAVNEKNSMHVERKEKTTVEQQMPTLPASKFVTTIPTGNDFNFAQKETIKRSRPIDPKLDPALKEKEQSNLLKTKTPTPSANIKVQLSKETENSIGINTKETVDQSVVIRKKTSGKEDDSISSIKSYSNNLVKAHQSEEDKLETLNITSVGNPNEEQNISGFKVDKEMKDVYEECKEKEHNCSTCDLTGKQPRQAITNISKPVSDDGNIVNENTCDSKPITEFLDSSFTKKTAPKPNRVFSDQTLPKVSEVGLTLRQEQNNEARQYSATKVQLLKPHESDETSSVKTSSSEDSSDTETERESDSRDSGMSERGDEVSTIIGSEERIPISYMIEVYKPWIKHHLKAPEIISLLELDERDKGMILSKHLSSSCDAVEMLIEVLHNNDSPGTWQKFMDAMRQKEFTLVYKILKCETENDQRSASKILELVKFDLRQRVYLPDFLDTVFGKDLLTEDDRQLVNAALKNQGMHAAADVLLERVDKHLPTWDVVFADVLKENHMEDIANLFRMVEQPDDEIQSKTRVAKKRRKKSERNESNKCQDAKALELMELKQSDLISWVQSSEANRGPSVEDNIKTNTLLLEQKAVVEDMKAEMKCLRREIKLLSDQFKPIEIMEQEIKALREDIKSFNKYCKQCGNAKE